jgi:hypothetical protein
MTPRGLRWSVACAVLATMAWAAPALAAPIVVTDAGAAAADIADGVLSFQTILGNPLNGNAPGPLTSGRREINWDGGGGVSATATAGTPFAGFQNIRGALFTTPGTGFVQATPSGLATTFGNATYGTIFQTFSPLRLFTPVGSNLTDATFFIPGSNGAIPATVSAFGAVFADVDLAGTSLQFFDLQGSSLGTFAVPVGTTADASLSFLGVAFTSGERIARVRIVSGNTALGPNDGGGVDVVALDDLLFAEPRAVPEPAGLMLVGLGAGVLALLSRLRARRT